MKKNLKKLGIFTVCAFMLMGASTAYAGQQVSEKIYTNTEVNLNNDSPTVSRQQHFENNIDMMYYHMFGQNFSLVQDLSKNINKSVYYDGLRMNIISTVSFTEAIVSESELDLKEITTFTFFTLHDETANRITNSTELHIKQGETWPRANFIHFDETTQTAFFVLESRNTYTNEGNDEYTYVDFTISQLYKDFVVEYKNINDINIANLLNTHEATLTHNEIVWGGWGSNVEDAGLDMDAIFAGKTLTKNELKIPIQGLESSYITNIALTNNILDIQTSTPVNLDTDTISFNNNFVLRNTQKDEYIYSIYTLGLHNHDEYFNPINNTEYTQRGFYIEDTSNIENYTLSVTNSYFKTIIDTNLSTSFYSPIIDTETVKIEVESEIQIGNNLIHIKSIEISPFKISIDIETTQDLNEQDIDVVDYVRDELSITLLFNDGTRQDYISRNWFGFGMLEDGSYNFSTGGDFINMDALTAIGINGTIFSV